MHEVLKRNLGYKIVSLLLAILFWLWVTNTNTTPTQTLNGDQTLTVTLVTKNIPSNSIVMTKLPSVRVRLKGNNPSVNVNDLYTYVDLSGADPGEHQYTIQMDPIPGVQIVELTPKTVNLTIDTVQEKMLPVQANITGTPAEGLMAGEPIIKPSIVNVRGPGSVLAGLDKVTVEMSIAEATESVTKSLPIMFRDKQGQSIFSSAPNMETLFASPGSVEVIVPIMAKDAASKTIPVSIKSEGEPAVGMNLRSLQAVPDRVQVWGKPGDLNAINALDLGTVSIAGLSENKTFQINSEKVNLPAGVSMSSGTNFTVVASIGKAAQTKTLTDMNVEVRNIPNELVLDQPPGKIEITVEAIPEILNQLTAGQILLWVDAAGQAEGSHSDVKVYWQLPSGVKMISTPSVSYSLKVK
ncbi:YbbR-like domain-containing protein [Desulfitobacterium sp.]|uniref:CdaR family protein n=1 Tax=Desulfitobacterium sp. TaxID=49981 RepID=UPI002B20A107|nr:CdaR family protein [Desulfitobacterium sp.]MEA4900695.1 CdaR family protein [Desulfitobacterium sp.]